MIADSIKHVVTEAGDVATRDPLNLDSFFADKLPAYNRNGQPQLILEQANRLNLDTLLIADISKAEALAITRDLGFIAASLEKHLVPLDEVPGLTETLCRLAPLTQEIPRDTIYSYTIRNPINEKRRTFTGYREELVFIEALEQGIEDCLKSLPLLVDVLQMSPRDPHCAQQVQACTWYLKTSVTVMLDVREQLPPRFFSDELRPYFPPVLIKGQQYFAPNGGQMPLALIDWLVWGADVTDHGFWEFFNDITTYYPQELRLIPDVVEVKQSLVSKSVAALQQHPNNIEVLNLAKETEKLLDMLLKFRFPHLRVAQANMEIRPENSKGSGGYDTAILQQLIDSTLAAKQRLHQARGEYKKQGRRAEKFPGS